MTAAIDKDVARHYTHGSLERVILAGLDQDGDRSNEALIDRLAAVDEFHIGGREATAHLASQLDLQPGQAVLDIGCGLGGTARFVASRYGCHVVGVDLTPEYVEVGNSLNRRARLHDRITFGVANATRLPFADASFDRATLLHVGMNIPDKRRLCDEIRRVVRPGGLFGLYDVMRTGRGPLLYPVPWAQAAPGSFVKPPEEYHDALRAAGCDIVAEENRRDAALAFFRAMNERVVQAGTAPLGLHILMGADAATKVANMLANLERDCIAPIQVIARRR